MTTETNDFRKKKYYSSAHYRSSAGDAVYGLGLIGALIFFISQATTFWMGVLGFLKAIIWPVFLVLEAFKALMM
jgi:hypothetical protein